MKISLSWIRLMNANYGTSDSAELDNVPQLVDKIGRQLGAVEEVLELGRRYKGAVVVKVVSVEAHPNADKLKLCKIDDGGVNKKVKRDKSGLIQVVCGAPNVKAGQLVAWLPPGVAVPSTYSKEPLVLEARPIRGQLSSGMIASGHELALNDDRAGIVVIEEMAEIGQPLAEVYQLNDWIIDIENKMFTHRPDCFGLLGVARELAGIYAKPFKSPAWYVEDASLPADGRKHVLKLEVKNELPKLVPRFCAVAVKDVKVGPSPLWLQSYLSRLGVRPINNFVDITNWFMLVSGQPLHAYDYDKLGSGTLGVRLSQKGEKLRLIGDKLITLQAGSVVITDGHKPVGLGGVMGGADTEVDETTRNIVFECANFNLSQTRRSAMTYGIFSDAATRFTKNQSPRQNRAVIVKAVSDALRLFGGRLASPLIDIDHTNKLSPPVEIDTAFINRRLGLELAPSDIARLLVNVEFKVERSGQKLRATPPFWRTDIAIAEDIVEEVGRLNGYDKLPIELPKRDMNPAQPDELLAFKSRLRDILSRGGANEALTYSFVHGSLLEKVGQSKKEAFHIRNALSQDLQYYRLSLMPSLLDKVHPNIRAGFDRFGLFEIGRAHQKSRKDPEGLPAETEQLALVWASKNPVGAPYFEAKQLCDYLLGELGIDGLSYAAHKASELPKQATYFEPVRSALIKSGGTEIGVVGEFKNPVKQALKLPAATAGFELDIVQLLKLAKPKRYLPLNRFPGLEQDFCLRSKPTLSYQELTAFMVKEIGRLSAPHGYDFSLKPLDIYQKKQPAAQKQTTWRILLWHPSRTLTTEETNQLLDKLAEKAKLELKAERI